MLEPHGRLIFFGGFFFGKMWKVMEKWPFFRAATAGLGKYCMDGYGRIGVYRVKHHIFEYCNVENYLLIHQVSNFIHCMYFVM